LPEGPECTIIANNLNEYLSNKTLTKLEILSGRYLNNPLANIDKLTNKKILSVSNKGKFIYWNFEDNLYLFSTLGMSGTYSKLLHTHSRVHFILDKNLDLYYNDVRNYGTLKVAESKELNIKLSELGPDMLNDPCSYQEFKKIIENKRISNKNLACFLLEQKRISGIGNIYKAEICYRSALDPSRNLSSLSEDDKACLYLAIKNVLETAYEYNGSSQRDYSDLNGKLGSYLSEEACVYRRKTDRNNNPILTASLGDGRTTWWCPDVQK